MEGTCTNSVCSRLSHAKTMMEPMVAMEVKSTLALNTTWIMRRFWPQTTPTWPQLKVKPANTTQTPRLKCRLPTGTMSHRRVGHRSRPLLMWAPSAQRSTPAPATSRCTKAVFSLGKAGVAARTNPAHLTTQSFWSAMALRLILQLGYPRSTSSSGTPGVRPGVTVAT